MKKIYEVETNRTNITPKAFYNACKKLMLKKGVDPTAWLPSFEDWQQPLTPSNAHTENEICVIKPLNQHLYYKGVYNFIMEFDFWDDKTGNGYMYVCEMV